MARGGRVSLPLERCANGCDAPPKPPSLVICGPCLDRIGARLARWAKQGHVDSHDEWQRAEATEAQPKPPKASR